MLTLALIFVGATVAATGVSFVLLNALFDQLQRH
jgi:hypothetical protein